VSDERHRIIQRWVVIGLAAIALAGAAHMFRWQAMPGEDFAWDRWSHRLCELSEAADQPDSDIAVYPACTSSGGVGDDATTVVVRH
jgi:hypothetical protein